MTLKKRYDLVYFFDCQDGNPNGDPDAGNMPRTDPETLQGLVSDGCQKRKLRDWVYHAKNGATDPAFDILFGHSGIPHRQVLNKQIAEAHDASLTQDERTELDKAKEKDREKARDETAKKHVEDARAYLCRNRYDVRTFGAVLSTGRNAGQVRGPIQCTFARSVDPVLSLEACITRKSLTKEEDAQEQIAKDGSITGTMGRKYLVPYGLYRSHWFASPMLAAQTGFTDEDFRVLCDGLLAMWDFDRSAARGLMGTRALYAFRHRDPLGNARSHALFERVSAKRADLAKPARSFSDYRLELDRASLPEGVEVFDLATPDGLKACFNG